MRRHVQAFVRYVSGGALRRARRHTFASGIAILTVSLLLEYRYLNGQETLDSFIFSQSISKGKKTAGLAGLDLKNKNPDLVYLGSYLVNGQAGCNQCHTCPSFRGIDPYKVGGQSLDKIDPTNTLNRLAGGTPFQSSGVTIVSPNLTPDSSGLPGGMSYDDFKNAMVNGASFHQPGHVLQVMPWPSYRTMNESDLNAIYQYLSSLPHNQPGTCTGPGQFAN